MNSESKQQRKSICFLTDFLTVGGMERVLCNAVDCLSSNYEITIMALNGSVSKEILSKIGSQANVIEYRCKQINTFLIAIPYVGSMLLRGIIRQKYDYLIILRGSFISAAHSHIATKTIFWNHGDKDVMYAEPNSLGLFRKINRIRLKVCYRRFDAVWTVNDFIKAKLERAFHLEKIAVLKNPIDYEEIIEKAAESVPEAFLNGSYNFVVVSRLTAEKAHTRLLQAMSTLKGEYSCRLIVVGDGPERESLEKYTFEHGLTHDVFFVGGRINPYPYIKKADTLVLPSDSESFGLVLLEAMTLKTPVLTTSTVGGTYLTNNGEYGLLVENSAEGILQGMQTYLENPNIGQKYIDKAAVWAKTFDLPAFVESLYELLENT